MEKTHIFGGRFLLIEPPFFGIKLHRDVAASNRAVIEKMIDELGATRYSSAFEIRFRFPELTTDESLDRVQKLIGWLSEFDNSEFYQLDVTTICPRRFTELVDDPTQFQKADVDEFFYNHTKRLGYKSYVKFYPEQKARTAAYLRSLEDR